MGGRVIHVLGTDTGVGKTAVACALAAGFRRRGGDAGVCKPFASGEDPSVLPGDAARLVLRLARELRNGAVQPPDVSAFDRGALAPGYRALFSSLGGDGCL